MIPLLQGLLKVQGIQLRCRYPHCDCAVEFPEGYRPSEETECPWRGETLEQTLMRLERTMRESQECLTCGGRPPMDHTNQFQRFDGFNKIIVLICDECKRKKWHERLDGIWR